MSKEDENKKIIKTDNGVNIKILSKDLCCIYGENENCSNYFIERKYLEELLSKEWN